MQTIEKGNVIGWALPAAAALWVALIVAAPGLAQISGGLAALIYAVGSLICHQLPERSFHLAGAQLPVCARCLGLYVGGAAGAVLWTVRARHRARPWRREQALAVLAVTAVPTAVTAGVAVAGFGDPSNAWRAALAVPLGFSGGRIVAAVATNHLK
jgi:uncharacterized membrane protein